MVNASNPVNRRRFLSTTIAIVGSIPFAGCSAIGGQPGSTDIVAYNTTNETKVVAVAITKSTADSPQMSRILHIGPGKEVNPVNRKKLPMNTDYTIEVNVAEGPHETFEWGDPTIERAPLYVLIDSQNIRFLLQAG